MEAPQKPENNSKEEPGFEDLSVKELQELDARPKFDRPCDITLVVSDGKEFKAHRDVLVESSPFLKKPFPQEACFRYGRPNSSKCLHLPACLAGLPKRTLDTLRPLAV